jgi:hypothetical protein
MSSSGDMNKASLSRAEVGIKVADCSMEYCSRENETSNSMAGGKDD